MLPPADKTGRFVAWLDEFLVAPLRRASDEQFAYLASRPGRAVDVQTIVVLVSTAVLLTIQHYVFVGGNLAWVVQAAQRLFPSRDAGWLAETLLAPENERLGRLAFWAIGQMVVYVVVPGILVRRVLRRPLADYGVKLRGMFDCWWAYLAMAAVMLPCVLTASAEAGFQRTYPFYQLSAGEALWPRFYVWEALYVLQFVALEFFFRGFVLHGTRRRFGPYAIFVMMVPYCMIHFGKPMPETCGAIGAGIVLGFMSLKTRSIWMGAALHIAVALTMDAAALWRQGRIG